MEQCLASEVIEWIQEPSGECDTSKLFTILNQARERMYQMYEQMPLFEIFECFEVQKFCVDCDACGDWYHGVTLPREHQTVERMWFNDLPVELFSSWREWQRGMSSPCHCGLVKYDMPGSYSTERDILPGHSSRLKVIASDPTDAGRKVTIRGKDAEGVDRTELLTLARNAQFTAHSYSSLGRGNGVVKERTAGSVILAEENERVLSIYAPDEMVPGYRRIKISGLRQCDSRVNIGSARRYFPVYRESDLVETNNRTAFEEMARFLRLNSKVNKDGNDLRTMAVHYSAAQKALSGNKAREIGKSTRASLQVSTPSFGPRRLGMW